MKNPKTTILGIVVLGAAVFNLLAEALPKAFAGDWFGAFGTIQSQWDSILQALAGVGLIAAADGSA